MCAHLQRGEVGVDHEGGGPSRAIPGHFLRQAMGHCGAQPCRLPSPPITMSVISVQHQENPCNICSNQACLLAINATQASCAQLSIQLYQQSVWWKKCLPWILDLLWHLAQFPFALDGTYISIRFCAAITFTHYTMSSQSDSGLSLHHAIKWYV